MPLQEQSIKLSNVAIVRLKGFEVACYPSKVVDYRAGRETDLDEVMQIETVFKNVRKGVVAGAKELNKVFKNKSPEEICVEIIKHGELQVSERERSAQQEAMLRDVAVLVSEKTIDNRTGFQPPVGAVEKYMREIHYAAPTSKSAKQQALDVIRRLEPLGIRRAPMRLLVCFEDSDRDAVLRALGVEDPVMLVEPKMYKDVVAKVEEASSGRAKIEVLDHAARGVEFRVDPPPPAAAAAAASSSEPPRRPPPPSSSSSKQKKKTLRCTTCGGDFPTPAAHRDHFKTEWHRHNLKLKLGGHPPLSEEDFFLIS
ncbi:hypothetical protein CTAYLR_000666 [Chrysophaeum taylorii]|uniref:C2H2-type domain-containing protein n=1 Tax=Chrysophaeum taylorii TaxID=2483200 RepID=A0AAD7XI87_9STRA|nr:hypothetical protein CTAYLR_000666 [Chrysophaeum taylorii]